MELSITVSPGELIDKVTILEIKRARIADPAKLRNVNHEYGVLAKILAAEIADTPALAELRAELKSVNEALWQTEEDLRGFERRKSFGQSFIDAARMVYISNDRRSEIKRRINELLGSGLIEEKSYASGSDR